jgi:hypothetical protein
MSVDQWDQREICPDGACTGVIGPQGTCKTCGRVMPNWGDPRRRGLIEEPEEKPVEKVAEDKGDWDERTLCADGSCTGVIGKQGSCKVCGKLADGSEPAEREIDDEESFENEDDHDDEDPDDSDDDDDRETASDEDDDEDDEDEDGDEEEDDHDDEADDNREAASADAAQADDDRKNCPDGACIGLIGANNKCKVCGKAAA